jgi:uncharacterized RDD family membrane protein YckC
MAQLMGPAFRREDYAGFIRRTAALLLDICIVLVASALIGAVPMSLYAESWTEAQEAAFSVGLFIICFIAYMIAFRLSLKGTPGYRLFRIRYAYMLDEKPTVSILLFRSFVWLVLLFFAWDYLQILFDEHKQAWHDKVSGFYVVKSKAQPVGMRRVAQRGKTFMRMTFIVWEPASAVEQAGPVQTA